jgi:uncharacterized protein YybS (DUF2232 family)
VAPPQGTGRQLALGAGLGMLWLLTGLLDARGGFGGLTALLNLIPLALALVWGGVPAATVALGVAVIGLVALVDSAVAVVLMARQALPGLVLGAALRRRLGVSISLILVSAASLAGLLVLVGLYVPTDPGVGGLLRREVETHITELERLRGRLGMASDPGWVADSARLAAAVLRVAAPAVVVVGLFLIALTNYLGARIAIRGAEFRPFAEEAVPDHLVWGVIGGGLLVVSQHEGLERFGLNLLLVLTPLYAIQGLAVLRHFFQRARLPRPLQGVGFGLFALQPLLLIAAACLGLTDLWADFRKIRRAATPA